MPTAERARPAGEGAGGDATAHVDRVAEDVVLAELGALHAAGATFRLVSEEVGERAYGPGDGPVVVVDPIDGSVNAKRGLPAFATSIAVARGPRLGDVEVAYLRDLASGEEVTAVRGRGVEVNGVPVTAPAARRLSIVALEGSSPRRVALAAPVLDGVYRIRGVGSLALALAWVGLGRLDGMAALRSSRTVDIAAACLVAEELGATVGGGGGESLADVPLDLDWRGALVAARRAGDLGPLLAAVRAAAAPAPEPSR